MKCPRCNQQLVPPGPCPECHLDFTILSDLDQLRASVHRLGADLDKRVSELATQIETVRRRIVQPNSATMEAPKDVLSPIPPPAPVHTPESVPPPHAPETFGGSPQRTVPAVPRALSGIFGGGEVIVGQRVLLLVGITSVVFGLLFFLKYSFDQNWVGPYGRVALGYLTAALFLGLGNYFTRTFRPFGLSLIGGGVASLYGSTFAAAQLYNLIPLPAAFLLMVGVTIFAGCLSVVYDSRWTAILGLAGGFVTPIALSSGGDHQLALMVYMLVLNGGILALAAFKEWRDLTALGFIGTWLLFTGWFATHYNDQKFWPTLLFITLFFLVYAVAPALSAGFFYRQPVLRKVAFGLFAATVLKAFLYDMAETAAPFRIASFTVLGAVLIGASYLYHRYKEVIVPEDTARAHERENV